MNDKRHQATLVFTCNVYYDPDRFHPVLDGNPEGTTSLRDVVHFVDFRLDPPSDSDADYRLDDFTVFTEDSYIAHLLDKKGRTERGKAEDAAYRTSARLTRDAAGVHGPLRCGDRVEVGFPDLQTGKLPVCKLSKNGVPRWHKTEVAYVDPTDLEPEPGIISWFQEDSLRARKQGWEIFQVDSGNYPPFELQYLTSPDVEHNLETDLQAWELVWDQAVQGDPLCKRALEFLYYRSPAEYKDIRHHCLARRRLKPQEITT